MRHCGASKPLVGNRAGYVHDGGSSRSGMIRTHYLDASALLKLLVDEEGSTQVRSYFSQHSVFATTSICFVECLAALKGKYVRGALIAEEYLAAAEQLVAIIRDQNITLEDVGIAQRNVFEQVEALVRKYGFDISDALQVVTLKIGMYSRLSGDSAPLLITADRKLATAAAGEGLRVWDCLQAAAP